MKDIYLLNYSVKGIKTIDQLVSLSFYKKTISNKLDTQEYNIKGIYGMNGSGKSAIITSVEILKNILLDSGYLSNPIVQKNLDAIIHKKTKELYIEADFLCDMQGLGLWIFQYNVTLSKDAIGKYVISQEELSYKKATSKSESKNLVFKVADGEAKYLFGETKQDSFVKNMKEKTANLLSKASLCSLFYEKYLILFFEEGKEEESDLFWILSHLFVFGMKIHVYLDQSDDHRDYVTMNYYNDNEDSNKKNSILNDYVPIGNDCLNAISITKNVVSKDNYDCFEKTIYKLYEFLHIFKSDLQGIEIEKKENGDTWVCEIIMNYGTYKIHSEYESTGIKKLIRLFLFISEMVQGGIVFIDEFDSNLHDVYLCALLEYLMEYGEGQLCFTTHNVGPMDILKRRKKSIDFLSENHKLYSWTKSGNYSPSKLYRNGMIEGSPFNVDSIDFIGVFDVEEGDE